MFNFLAVVTLSDFSGILLSTIEIVFEWPFQMLNNIRLDSGRFQFGYVLLALIVFSVIFALFIRNRQVFIMCKKKLNLKKYLKVTSFDRFSLLFSLFVFLLTFTVILIQGIPESTTAAFTILATLMLMSILWFIVTLLVVIIHSTVLIIKQSIRARSLPSRSDASRKV